MVDCEIDSNVSRRFPTFRAENCRTFTPFTTHIAPAHGTRKFPPMKRANLHMSFAASAFFLQKEANMKPVRAPRIYKNDLL